MTPGLPENNLDKAMTQSFNSPSEKSGLPPGSLIHVGEIVEPKTSLSVIRYNKEELEEHSLNNIEELINYKGQQGTTWIIVEGLTDIPIIENIGKTFGIHQLVLEDILNTDQRPKFEEHDNYCFMVLKYMSSQDDQFNVAYEQISILMMEYFVIVFKEKKDILFHPLQQRIRKSKGQLRSLGADYLTYEILDTIVDQYFNLIDSLNDAITPLEERLLAQQSDHDILNAIQRLKRELIHVRRNVSPVRELMAEMLRNESELIHDKTRIYLRDVSDHAIRVVETIESYRDILTSLLEIYISGISNRMNEIMKVLTLFASIFIPLTFIAGIYGMNFEYMPELQWQWAYPALWILFLAIPVALLLYFRHKKWL